MSDTALPYAGIRVVEFVHMVMGPACGLIFADLGAEVIRIEPVDGDSTRNLLGSGAGFFPAFNRNKKSVALDLKSTEGREVALRLIESADIVSENFRPGTMRKLGLDYETAAKLNPGVIYVSHKGFLPGPYEDRSALDEVVQMMGGLAFMTGRPGDPLRAGTSINDIMGGMFGAIGAMAALHKRATTGKGCEIQSSLFENNAFLVSQHMLQQAVTGRTPDPMPARISAWAIYDVFTVKNGEQIFLAAVSDKQWSLFCTALGLEEMLNDQRLTTNNQRVQARDWMIPCLRSHLEGFTADELAQIFETNKLPYAPIRQPHELLDDPHLQASGGLAPIRLSDGRMAQVPLLPLALDGQRLGLRDQPPEIGEHTRSLLASVGYDDDQIQRMMEAGAAGGKAVFATA